MNTDVQEESANLEEGAVIERLPQTSPADELNQALERALPAWSPQPERRVWGPGSR